MFAGLFTAAGWFVLGAWESVLCLFAFYVESKFRYLERQHHHHHFEDPEEFKQQFLPVVEENFQMDNKKKEDHLDHNCQVDPPERRFHNPGLPVAVV